MLESGENIEKLVHKDTILSINFTRDGKFMATCDKRGTIQFYQNTMSHLLEMQLNSKLNNSVDYDPLRDMSFAPSG